MPRYDTYFSFLPTPIFDVLHFARVQQLTLTRYFANLINLRAFAGTPGDESDFPHILKKHQSLIRRRLGNSDPVLQENKATNLRMAIPRISNVVMKPGQVFSFCFLIGKPTAEKGYVEGMQLSRGEVKTGVGGGLCQLTNLLYWLALHSPLDIVERHHHSFDPFPDDNRTLPFGSGAGVFYNYIDLRFKNNTTQSFMFHLLLTDQHLKGQLRSDRPIPYGYHIEEQNHRFFHRNGKTFRENEIFRRITSRKTGVEVRREKVMHNVSEVKYDMKIDGPELAAL
jgi:vancomycin resistance protein VanW